MRTRFHVSKFLSPDICRRNVSMSVFPEFKSLKLIGFNVSSYLCTFPTVLRCPSCLSFTSWLWHHGVYGYPSPSSSLRCPNSCHERPRAHKLAPSSWGMTSMTSMTSMTFERWDVCLKQPGSQKGGHLFLMHIIYRSLSTSAFAILDLVKACHGCWVYQLHPSSEMCEIRILSSGIYKKEQISWRS